MHKRLIGWTFIGLVLAALSLVAFVLHSHAAEPVLDHCTFTWTDTDAGLAAFNLKLGTTSGGPYALLKSLPVGPAPGTYTADLCAGLSGGLKYAVVTAVTATGQESGPSNEVAFFLLRAPTSLGVR